MKLVPQDYNITILPAFFNHTDGERIGTIVRDTSTEFLLNTKKKVMFSIAVKVFPYNSNVNSVRVLLVKMEANEMGQLDKGGGVGDKSSSKNAKSNKSKSDMGSVNAK